METNRSRGTVFGEMGDFWAEIADQSQTTRQIGFLKSQLHLAGLLLDVACGTGRHTIALSTAGFDVVGLDISANLLRIAKTRGAKLLVRADMRFLPFKRNAFTAVVCMDNSFGYLPSEKEDTHSLTEVKNVLSVGGLFLLDLFNRKKLIAKHNPLGASPKLYEYPSFTLRQERTVSSDGEWLSDHWTIQQHGNGQIHVFNHKVHLYTLDQLEHMLSDAGFCVLTVFGGYEKQPFSGNAPRLIIKATPS
jgi:SAM-dependent methyltransferase